MGAPTVSVVVPNRNRAGYLEVALASLGSQDLGEGCEIVVVDDGSTDTTAEVVGRSAARCVALGSPGGLNAARNLGVRETHGSLVAFVDDDVWAPPGWARALAEGAARHRDAEAFGGPIRARIEGRAPRACGREKPPITTLDLGEEDVVAPMVWGANFDVRREAFERHGPFDERLAGHGDEEEWLLSLRAAGGRIVYLAAAGLDHRRTGQDSRLRSLARAAYHRGRAARRTDTRRGVAPSTSRELRNVAGAGWHTVRRACPQGIVMGAHSAGRLIESVHRR